MASKSPRLYLQQVAAWLTHHEIWPVGLGVLLASISLRFAPWGLGLLAIIWGSRWLGRGYLTRRTPVDWPVILLLGMSGVAWGVTVDRAATALALSRLLAGLTLMYSLVNWASTRARLIQLLWGATLGALVLAVFTPMVIPWRRSLESAAMHTKIPRLWNTPLNPNMVAGVLAMLLPFPLMGTVMLLLKSSLFLETLPHLPPVSLKLLPGWCIMSLPTAIIALGALNFTQSRGGWLAVGVATFVIALNHNRRFLWLLPAPIVAMGWLVWRGKLMAFLDALGAGGLTVGWDKRVDIWQCAWYLIRECPFTGAGADTYALRSNTLCTPLALSFKETVPHAHNLYLQIALDLGIPGLVAFLILIIVVFSCALRCGPHCVRLSAFNSVKCLVVWVSSASLAAMLTHGLVDTTAWITGWGAPLPWFVMGALLAAWGIENDTPAMKENPA